MQTLPEVNIVGIYKGSMEMLQRRVGGILKGIARVSFCSTEEVDKSTAQVLVCYSHGKRLEMLQKKFKNGHKKVIGVELALLPVGVKTLRMAPPDEKLGIIAEHRNCANWFFVEVVQAGIGDYHCEVGTFQDMPQMNVDKFVVSEEMQDVIPKCIPEEKVILVPRTISPLSAAAIIDAVLKADKLS